MKCLCAFLGSLFSKQMWNISVPTTVSSRGSSLCHISWAEFGFFILKIFYVGLEMSLPGALLLEEVVSSCGRQGIDAIIGAATKRFSESQQQKAAGLSAWWRVSENL